MRFVYRVTQEHLKVNRRTFMQPFVQYKLLVNNFRATLIFLAKLVTNVHQLLTVFGSFFQGSDPY